jgi:hypothetical protein
MDFKDFSFSPDIRVSIYHVGHENLAYHRHTHVSDITYCASGRLMLELPALGTSYLFHPGQFVQVPCDTVHRVSHCGAPSGVSTYILVQIGPFSIDLGATTLGYRIGNAREPLLSAARQMREARPANLSDTEYDSILGMLDTVCKDGIARPPEREALIEQFRALGAGLADARADH